MQYPPVSTRFFKFTYSPFKLKFQLTLIISDNCYLLKGIDAVNKMYKTTPQLHVSASFGSYGSFFYGLSAKDCYSTCQGTQCNDNLEVADMLTEDVFTECYNCKFNELTGSNHDDVEQCKESPIEETKMSCPRWARAACFVADAVVEIDDDYRHGGTDLVTIYRGCSSFSEELFGSMMKCSTITVDVGVDTDQPDRRTASICKQLCSESDDCNNILRYPDFQPPEECPPCDEPTTTDAWQTTEEPTEEPATDAPDVESSTSTITTTTATTASAATESLLFALLFIVLVG